LDADSAVKRGLEKLQLTAGEKLGKTAIEQGLQNDVFSIAAPHLRSEKREKRRKRETDRSDDDVGNGHSASLDCERFCLNVSQLSLQALKRRRSRKEPADIRVVGER
jgi:hypothetical protein